MKIGKYDPVILLCNSKGFFSLSLPPWSAAGCDVIPSVFPLYQSSPLFSLPRNESMARFRRCTSACRGDCSVLAAMQKPWRGPRRNRFRGADPNFPQSRLGDGTSRTPGLECSSVVLQSGTGFLLILVLWTSVRPFTVAELIFPFLQDAGSRNSRAKSPWKTANFCQDVWFVKELFDGSWWLHPNCLRSSYGELEKKKVQLCV